MSDKKTESIDDQIEGLFGKFTEQIMVHCRTDEQKNNTLGIARLLWLLLVIGVDSEENVYTTVHNVSQNDEMARVFTALYFRQMKSNLTPSQIEALKTHYDDPDNYATLENWGDMFFMNERH